MTPAALLAALALPAEARLGQRVPKKLLLEHGAQTAADKRLIRDGVEAVEWAAVLKPTTIGVPAYRDGEREYLEIHVLAVALREAAKEPRLAALIHRAIPYPLFLAVEQGARVTVSVAEKRWSLGEAGRMVLDGEVVAAAWTAETGDSAVEAFGAALSVSKQPRSDIRALYLGWLNAVSALAVSQVSGTFRLADSPSQMAERQAALVALQAVEKELTILRSTASKSRQMARQVDLNLAVQRLTAQRQDLLARL